MDRFLNWLRANKVALIVATAMFAVMAVVMALMLNEDLMGNLGTIFSDDATKTMSPFLWVWRAGGALTWPVFLILLLSPFRRPDDPSATTKVVSAAFVGAAYGGLGLWGLTALTPSLASSVPQGSVGIALLMLLAVETLSLAYTWGFCAIYGVCLSSLTGRKGTGWVLPSIGFTLLGRYVGPVVISVLLGIVMGIVIWVASLAGQWDFLLVAVPAAIALSTGNFAGQWLSFWKVHDHILGIMPMPRAVPYPGQYPYGATTPYGYPAGQPAPQGYPQQPAQPMPQAQPPYASPKTVDAAARPNAANPNGTYGVGQ